MEVIAGINLPMLIRLAGARTKMSVTDAVEAAQEAGVGLAGLVDDFEHLAGVLDVDERALVAVDCRDLGVERDDAREAAGVGGGRRRSRHSS